MRRDIYIAIMVAAHRGVGLRLSFDEVAALSLDEAIHQAALNGLEEVDWPNWQTSGEPRWKSLDPYRKRNPADLVSR